MKKCTFLYFLLSVLYSYSQVNFEKIPITNNFNGTFGANLVTYADLDSDGDLDVVFASDGQRKIGWYENINGLGKFGVQKIITTNSDGTTSIVFSDIDDDGDIDVLASSARDNKISWYKNLDGLGNFSVQIIISTEVDLPNAVYVADIDNDGDVDVLSASSKDNKIAWYENTNRLGNFGAQQIIDIDAKGAKLVSTKDIDLDGDLDVISTSAESGEIATYRNLNGLGNFDKKEVLLTVKDVSNLSFAIDLDGDNDLDILSSVSSRLVWYQNLDGTNYASQEIISYSGGFINKIITADIDSDNDLDIVLALNNKLVWYENTNGKSMFSEQKEITRFVDKPQFIAAADIDNNGSLDILSASYDDDKIAWHKNIDGKGNFDVQQVISRFADFAYAVFSADMDNDGDKDVLSASFVDDQIICYKNEDGKGSFDSQQVISTNSYGINAVFAADIDGDDYLDVLSASQGLNEIAWHKNNNGTWELNKSNILKTNLKGAISVHAADLDNDGDNDIISVSYTDRKIAWYENTDGLGNFSTENIITTSANGATTVDTSDLDNDGDLDILSSSSLDDKLAWYKNDGKGNFSSEQIISENIAGATSVHAVDIDNDGDNDVVGASPKDNKVVWFQNVDGLGNFAHEAIITDKLNGAKSIYSSDIDNDGDKDILVAARSADRIVWLENKNNYIGFNPVKLIAEDIKGANSVFATDLDNDGDIDVLSASYNDNSINWYKNLSVTASINDVFTKSLFSLVPNPTNNILEVKSSRIVNKIELFNNLGQLVLKKINKSIISVSSLNNGVYFCKVTFIDGKLQTKIMIKE